MAKFEFKEKNIAYEIAVYIIMLFMLIVKQQLEMKEYSIY